MKRLLEFSQLNEATRSPRTLTKGWVNIVTGQIIEWTDMDQYHAMYMLKNLDKFRNIEYTELWGLLGDETLGSLETGELDRYEVEQYMNFVHSRGWFGYFVGKDLGGVYVDNLRQAQAAVKALEKKGYSYSSIFTRPSKFASDGFAVTIANKRPFKEYFLKDAQMWKHFVRTGKILDTSKRSEIGNTMAMFRGESVELNEATRTVYKGWIHPRKRKTIVWETREKPWHVQKIVQNPKQFGYTNQDLINAVENGIHVLVVPVEEYIEQLAVGDRDVQWDIESMLLRDGWSRITVDLIDGASDIYVQDLKSGVEVVKILLKEIEALPLTITYIWIGKDRITRREFETKSRKVQLKIPKDYEDFVQTGKAPDTRRKRTEIGNTMAMFRESKLQEKTYAKSGLGKWMNQQSAGGGPGWDRYGTDGQKLGKCGDAKEGEPYSACLSRQKADKLGKKGIASFVRRKRDAQKEAGRGDVGDGGKGKKPINVKTGVTDKDPEKKGIQDDWSAKYKRSIDCDNPKGFSQRAHCQGRMKREDMHTFSEFSQLEERKNEPKNPSLWQKAIAKAKSKFDVYPSAYANAWAAKWYKSQGGEWKAVQESEGEDKPLIKWFDEFERQLKKAGGDYANVKPTDMLKLYYKGVNPRDAAKQLKEEDCGCGCDEMGYEEEIDEAIIVDGLEEIIIQEEGEEKKVDLNNPFRTPGGPKKFSVYVKNDKGNVVKVNFGDPNMSIKRDNEERLKSFRARHGCDKDPGPKWKAKYWSCKFWEKGSPVSGLLKKKEVS